MTYSVFNSSGVKVGEFEYQHEAIRFAKEKAEQLSGSVHFVSDQNGNMIYKTAAR